MARVCVDCGTPKLDLLKRFDRTRDWCAFCDKDTLTREGKPRNLLCHSCVNFKVRASDGQLYSVLDFEEPKPFRRGRCHYFKDADLKQKFYQSTAFKITRYDHSCDGYEKHHLAPQDPSPNPISSKEVEQYHQFADSPTAFWLDPERWQDIEADRENFWEDPKEKSSKLAAVAAGVGGVMAALGALSIKKKLDQKT